MIVAAADPYAIFARARQYWEAARYPAQVSYNVVVSVKRTGVSSSAHYRSYYDFQTRAVKVIAVTDEELAHPYTPHGINASRSMLRRSTGRTTPS